MRLETIQAAGYYTKLVRNYYETITKEDNLLKKVATPKKYTTNNKMLNNAYYDCKKTGSYSSNVYISYTFELLENPRTTDHTNAAIQGVSYSNSLPSCYCESL